jgi:hypothetical protein
MKAFYDLPLSFLPYVIYGVEVRGYFCTNAAKN